MLTRSESVTNEEQRRILPMSVQYDTQSAAFSLSLRKRFLFPPDLLHRYFLYL